MHMLRTGNPFFTPWSCSLFLTFVLLTIRVLLDPETPLLSCFILENSTPADFPSGSTAIVTGGSNGMGFEVAKTLAAFGVHVVLAARDEKEGGKALRRILDSYPSAMVEFEQVDLSSMSSVKRFVRIRKRKSAMGKSLDYLILNAGVMARTYRESMDGVELMWAVNVVGNHALVLAFLKDLIESKGRVVYVSSSAHRAFLAGTDAKRFDSFPITRKSASSYSFLETYGATKAANAMLARELAKRYGAQGLQAYSVHPGTVRSNWAVPRSYDKTIRPVHIVAFETVVVAPFVKLFWFILPFTMSESQGAATILYPALGEFPDDWNGSYFTVGKRRMNPSDLVMDPVRASRLYENVDNLIRYVDPLFFEMSFDA